jgi:hypothetical protein
LPGLLYQLPAHQHPSHLHQGRSPIIQHPGMQHQISNPTQPGYQYQSNDQTTGQTPNRNGYATVDQNIPTHLHGSDRYNDRGQNGVQPVYGLGNYDSQQGYQQGGTQRQEDQMGYYPRGKVNDQYQPVIQGPLSPQYQPGVQHKVDQTEYQPRIQTNHANGNKDLPQSSQYGSHHQPGVQPVGNKFEPQGQGNADHGIRFQPGSMQQEIDQSLYYPRGQIGSLYQPGPQPTAGLGNQNVIPSSPQSGSHYQPGLRQPEVIPSRSIPQSHVGGQYQVGAQQSSGLTNQDQSGSQYGSPFQPGLSQQGYYPRVQTSDNYQPVTQYGLANQGVGQPLNGFQPSFHSGDQMGSGYQRPAGLGSQSGTPVTGNGQQPGYNSNDHLGPQPSYNYGQPGYPNGAYNNQRNVQTPNGPQLGAHTNQYQPSSQTEQQGYGRIPHGSHGGAGTIDQRIPADLISDREQIIGDLNKHPQSSISTNTNVRPFVEYGTEQYPASVDLQTGYRTNLSSQNTKTDDDKKSDSVEKSEDDAFSQAESSIKNGQAVASAQGRKNGGTAQTQVTGTYGGNGSFSASAQTSDKDRSAQAQVTGGKDGALSSAQGAGGVGKSQAQVNLNTKTGGTSATSQSGGLKHESQSEVSIE